MNRNIDAVLLNFRQLFRLYVREEIDSFPFPMHISLVLREAKEQHKRG